MASIDKSFFARPHFRSGASVPVQTLTEASTGTLINNYGLTVITKATTADKAYKLARPVKGIEKTILANAQTGITIRSVSTAVTFYPTTSNLITGATAGAKISISLIGLSTSQWGLVSKSTGVTLSGSTLD